MGKKLCLFGVLAILAFTVPNCDDGESLAEKDQTLVNDTVDETNKDIITQNFYVFDVNKDEQCGYLLFEDTGSPSHFHGFFVWAENLPKEFQEYLLPVTVTFNYTGEICGSYSIIDITKIQKQQKE